MVHSLDVVGLIGGALIAIAALVEIVKSGIRHKDVGLLRSLLLLAIGFLIVAEEVVKMFGFSVTRMFYVFVSVAMFILAVTLIVTYLKLGEKRTEVEKQLVTS